MKAYAMFVNLWDEEQAFIGIFSSPPIAIRYARDSSWEKLGEGIVEIYAVPFDEPLPWYIRSVADLQLPIADITTKKNLVFRRPHYRIRDTGTLEEEWLDEEFHKQAEGASA